MTQKSGRRGVCVSVLAQLINLCLELFSSFYVFNQLTRCPLLLLPRHLSSFRGSAQAAAAAASSLLMALDRMAEKWGEAGAKTSAEVGGKDDGI